jgi:autotransporter-associated beta strand protein
VANVQGGGIKIDSAGFNVAISQVLTGTGGLEKSGAGSLTLSGASTFTGATTVTAGTLELNNTGGGQALGATTLVSVSGATLLVSASNQVNNNADVTLSGGTILRGAGVSEVFGNLNITTGSFLDFGTGATGNLTFGTYQDNQQTESALLTINNFLPGNSFTFTSTSFTTNSMGNYFSFGTGYVGSSISSAGSTFTITAIPEPSTILAAGALALLFAGSRIRFPRRNKIALE